MVCPGYCEILWGNLNALWMSPATAVMVALEEGGHKTFILEVVGQGHCLGSDMGLLT